MRRSHGRIVRNWEPGWRGYRAVNARPRFSIRSDPLRRRTVRFFASASDRTFEFDELVNHLARGDGLAADARARGEFAIDLHHRHLPKYAESEVIEYDPHSRINRYPGAT